MNNDVIISRSIQQYDARELLEVEHVLFALIVANALLQNERQFIEHCVDISYLQRCSAKPWLASLVRTCI